MVAPRDTWFGRWRYDATVNPGRDKIKGVHNFTGGTGSEIMIWSSWGIATLAYNSVTLSPSRIYRNGERLGGWLLNTADNVYCGSGQFGCDPSKEMVVMSPWGLGIISLQCGSHVYMAPNGTRCGGWLLNSQDNSIRLIADFNGDGMDEILIGSPWGIGILGMAAGALTSLAMHANDDNLGGYSVNNNHHFVLADNLKRGAEKQILVMDATGISILSLVGSRLRRIVFAANGTRIDGWVIDTDHNQIQSAGDMNGDGRAEFVIRSPWGLGIMGVDEANHLRCYCMFPYGSVLNDWYLQGGDMLVGSGNLSGGADGKEELLMVKP
jgi:hypothetical protein